ncbi:MAG: NIL domain-containing protein [Armatimonadota bacterium]
MQVNLVYHVSFHAGMADQPILQHLFRRFELEIVVRRAILSPEGGWAELEVKGSLEEANRALAWLQTTGVGTTGPLVEEEASGVSGRSMVVGTGRGT